MTTAMYCNGYVWQRLCATRTTVMYDNGYVWQWLRMTTATRTGMTWQRLWQRVWSRLGNGYDNGYNNAKDNDDYDNDNNRSSRNSDETRNTTIITQLLITQETDWVTGWLLDWVFHWCLSDKSIDCLAAITRIQTICWQRLTGQISIRFNEHPISDEESTINTKARPTKKHENNNLNSGANN